MGLFSSTRERNLWLWALAAVVAIYSTLGLARTLVGMVDRELVDATFMFSFSVMIVAIVLQALKARPRGAEIGVVMGVVAVYVMVFLRMLIPEHRSHLIEYTVVALLVYEALTERVSNGGGIRRPALLAVSIATLAGLVDECIQLLLPSRVFDPIDMLFNALAALMAVVASATMGWVRRRRTRVR